MEKQTIIELNQFQPRDYQLTICDALENKGYKRIIAILPRRCGKDFMMWQLCIRECLRKTQAIYYCLPTFSQGKQAVFDCISNDGVRYLDMIPPQLIKSINNSEQKIVFQNDSILKVIGGDNYNRSLVGCNPSLIVFSEYSLMDPMAWSFARPILAGNGGKAVFLSTPRGHNWLWDLWNQAQNWPDWFLLKLTVEDTKHIPTEVLERERQQMSEELYLQEYMTSWDRGVEGSYYAKNLNELIRKSQIGSVAWDPNFKVHTAWDIGVHDATCIIFYQVIAHGDTIRIIDVLTNTNVGLDWYAREISRKPYQYGRHFGPPDLAVREWAGGAVTRIEKARQLGIDFTIVPALSIDDGIEAVWSHFHKFWIDEVKCKQLIHALENYHREWDDKLQRHKDHPVHDCYSNFADAMRYLALSLPNAVDGVTNEEIEASRQRCLYGKESKVPRPLRDHPLARKW